MNQAGQTATQKKPVTPDEFESIRKRIMNQAAQDAVTPDEFAEMQAGMPLIEYCGSLEFLSATEQLAGMVAGTALKLVQYAVSDFEGLAHHPRVVAVSDVAVELAQAIRTRCEALEEHRSEDDTPGPDYREIAC